MSHNLNKGYRTTWLFFLCLPLSAVNSVWRQKPISEIVNPQRDNKTICFAGIVCVSFDLLLIFLLLSHHWKRAKHQPITAHLTKAQRVVPRLEGEKLCGRVGKGEHVDLVPRHNHNLEKVRFRLLLLLWNIWYHRISSPLQGQSGF